MCRYYRKPILLIEFDNSRAFAMNAASDITSEISNSSIISKLSLLCIHFPALRVIWSRDPEMTADVFYELKQLFDEPDEAAAVACGACFLRNFADLRSFHVTHVVVQEPAALLQATSRVGISLLWTCCARCRASLKPTIISLLPRCCASRTCLSCRWRRCKRSLVQKTGASCTRSLIRRQAFLVCALTILFYSRFTRKAQAPSSL
jgi:hypothetical protein